MLRILHPTDFSPASDVAFAHALKLALAGQGSLTIFHYAHRADAEDDAHEFPQVRQTLTRWGVLPGNSPREAVAALGLHVRKVEIGGDDPTSAVLAYLEKHDMDLIVLATHQRSGLSRWLSQEVASPLTRKAAMPALFVPPHVDGFVNAATGDVRLQRILITIDRHPHPHAAIELVPALVDTLHATPVVVELLHVGTPDSLPRVQLPDAKDVTWNTQVTEGSVVDAIVRAVETGAPDLLMLTTQGRRGFLDALRGSTSEQIVRRAKVPVLAVPVSLEAGP